MSSELNSATDVRPAFPVDGASASAGLTEIAPKIREFVSHNFLFSEDGFPYDDDASFLGEGIIDSLGIIELVPFVEKEFKISVGDHELLPNNFDSVNKLVAFIGKKLNAGA
jgi:acyl carrier protein